VLAQQHAELLDPSHPRDAVIVPKGAQVPDIAQEKWRYGKLKLPDDGGTVLYDHSRGSKWTKDTLKAAAQDGTLRDKIDAQAAKAPEPSPVAGAKPAPAPERAEAPGAGVEAQPTEVQEPSVQPTDVSQTREEPVTQASKPPEPELLAENKAGIKLYRNPDPEGKPYLKVAPGKDPMPMGEDTAKLLFHEYFGTEGYVPEKSEADKIREAADAEAARIGLAKETPPAEPKGRVLRSETPEEREAAARQAEADRAAAERVATEQPTAKVIKPKEEMKPSKDKKRNEAQAANNRIADEVVNRHPSKEIEARAIDPSKEGGKGARAALMSRLKEMLEDAKTSKYEMMQKAKHRTDEGARHSNKALILYEAKLLLGKGAKAKTEDYMRFLHNEHRLLTGGEDAYNEVLGERAQSGRETAAERGKGVKETGVEDVEATKGTEAEETADEAHERELEKALEAKRTMGERLKEKEAQEREAREKEAKRQAELKAEADLKKRALPTEPEIISPARAKLMDQDRVARERLAREETRTAPQERPPIEVEEGEHYTPVKQATGFQTEVRKSRGKWSKEEELVGPEYYLKGLREDEGPPGKGEIQLDGALGKVNVRPSRTTDAEQAIKETYKVGRYASGAAQAMGKLRDMVVRIAGDTPVHYLSNDEMNRVMGNRPGQVTYGAFHPEGLDGKPVIILNADHISPDTPLHEAFHAATEIAISENPGLGKLMERLRVEVLKNLPDMTTKERSQIGYYLSSRKEFLTGMMTHPKMQELLKGVKISDQLANDIGISKWRKMTMWEGALAIIRDALGLGPRDVSAIEAAMSLGEQLMWRDPRGAGDLMAATGRLAKRQMEAGEDRVARPKWARQEAPPERDQEAFYRSPKEALSRVKDIDRTLVKQYGKDTIHNLGGSIMRGTAKLLSGTWLNDMHGHLFEDARGKILEAINHARDKVSRTYSQLMGKDTDIINRGYMLDKTYASSMPNYAKLLDMSLRYNIHADREAPAVPKNPADAARRYYQRDKFGDEARALYRHLPEELQKRYRAEKKYYMDKQGEAARIIVENVLPLFPAPKGSTRDEVMTRARTNEMTEADWTHYEKLGVADQLHEAYRLQNGKDVFFNSQRGDGRQVVNGYYPMPKGGKEVAYSGEELPDHVREFDTEAQAHAYATGTRMKATVREINYHKDTSTGEITRVTGEEAASVGDITSKYRVSLERQNYQTATSRAEAERNRQAMAADGVENLSGVMDKRDEQAWSKINSADQKIIEHKIDSNENFTDAEKQHLKDITRQMMLSSRGGMSSHMIQARKVAGAKFDTAAGLHAYAKAINFHIARQSHAPELNEAMDRLDAHERAMRSVDPDNALRRSIVAHEYMNRVYGRDASPMGSTSSPFMHKMMTWAFINFLARPSHILLSQIHPYIYSVPMMAARHGYWKSLQGQRQAMRDLGGMGHNLMEGVRAGVKVYKSGGEQNIDKAVAMAHGVDPVLRMINGLKHKDERDALMKMWETEHLHSAFDASVFSGSGMDRTNAIVRQFTDAMEANNRLSTALNAYRLERDMHKGKDAGNANALAYSRRVIEQTHGVFSPTNAATAFKNPIIRPIMQFRQQPMNLAIMMYRNIAKSLPEKMGGAGDNEARWTLAYQLGTAAALGGMGGMPMDLPKLVGLGGQALGGPSPADWDDRFYRTLVSNLGETAAKAIHDGLPGMMGPYGPSLGHRTGFDAGFLFGEPSSDRPDDLYAYTAKSLAGASVGMGVEWLQALHDAEQGDYERAGESFLPGTLKDMFKTYRLATEGQMAGKQQITQPGSMGDELLQMLGFSGVERERLLAGHFALQKAMKADEAARQSVGAALKAKHASREKTVLGVKVPRKEGGLAQEYEHAYQ
jgi:hypothetical protein